jgi:hypothetical protein
MIGLGIQVIKMHSQWFFFYWFFCQQSTKAPNNSQVTILLLSSAMTNFKTFCKGRCQTHFFNPICIIVINYIQTYRKHPGDNFEKFQLKRLICSRAIIFICMHSSKNALKTGTSQKSTWDTQLCLKRRRMWMSWPNKAIWESFCREINAQGLIWSF